MMDGIDPRWLVRESIINLRGEGFRLRDNDRSVRLVLADLRDVFACNETSFDESAFAPLVRESISENLSTDALMRLQEP